MNGKKILLDTNIVLYLLGGKININNIPEGNYLISVITEIELLSYPLINKEEIKKIKKFLSKIDIIELNNKIKYKTIEYRKNYNLKIPDAIICATANIEKAMLITNDKHIYKSKNKPDINILSV